ncbi:transcription cofactor vestigial-like protein 2a isoform X3 [Oncorhynchus kisutch]|nr:transcription cofactor vestigial-like protein 2 isoform X3 [Oncorhynchus kisutch]XP_031656781.1 transcription cofactor vestigial-like protein 2 isoform X3 [Oncorhynchus kisutch]
MQEAQESISGGSSFSNLPGPTIKEEDCAREKDHPPEAEYLNSRCVLFTYFHGDISSVVDEHFSRALSQPTSYVHGSASNKSARDGLFPMSQRSFPPSFWNSAYQPSSLSSALGSSYSDIPFPGDPYSSASLHSHLHQATPEPWHHSHHHHHSYSLGGAIGTQGSPYPRPSMHEVYGTHFDPRYSSLLVPSVRPHRLPPSTVPGPSASPCDIGKSESASSAWTGAFTGAGAGADISQSIGLNVDAGLQVQDKSKDLYWF